MQYLKLNNRNPYRQKAADRIEVREYVREKVGERYLIPLLLETDELSLSDWESLPNRFVLKASHGCGMLKLVFEKSAVQYDQIYLLTQDWLNFDYAKFGREWVYEEVPRKIVAEKLITDSENEIPEDYKFFCFHGRVEMIQIDIGRFKNQRRNLYTRDFQLIDAKCLYPNSEKPVTKPQNLHEMLEVAEKLASEFNFIRVDLYSLSNRIYFGELTNFPGNGFIPYQPDSFDFELGKKLKL
ncbi:ATP-grasp fold amidoligase family protein [Rhodohalobacter sp.]|uniref:ATP-grasp fold amidoligase family protein n=1 Tax=Rhodohalobacter sp. TaxID=1974210 RepID=UPI002ACE01BD|nr:ATP-grasp fold amidoligase family protein [Rhodohalobacter sp.]MDZ7758180.1 ATP-grasp fold amidoligase family protein [Rhodohalobacter sp.]